MRAISAGWSSLAGSYSTAARSEARLTCADWTPSSFLRLRSIVATQLAQVMPVMGRVIVLVAIDNKSALRCEGRGVQLNAPTLPVQVNARTPERPYSAG